MNKPNTKSRSQEADMSADLKSQIAAAKLVLNTALLTGGETSKPRAALRALEAEQHKVDAAAAAQNDAQQALKQIEADHIAEAVQEMLAARSNRIAVLVGSFAVPAHV